MANMPVAFGNKIIQQKEQQKNMQVHYASLRRVRPITGKIAEYHDNITLNNNKKQMNIQNRFTQIQRENRMLLEKITSIMAKGSTINTISRNQGSQGKLNKSLNSSYRKKQMQSIELQNAKMLKRLKQKRSSYQVGKLNQDWRKRKQVIKNMTNYPFIINDNLGARNTKAYSQYDFKRFNNQNLWKENQIVRLRKIDDVSFLITVKIQAGKLFIIADCKQDKQIKVIQLPRSQAEEFLYHECKSNIQNVFNLLRYDRSAGVLYLVGNDVEGVQEIRQIQDQKRITQTADASKRGRIPSMNKQLRPISKQSIRRKKYQPIQALNQQDERLQFSAKQQKNSHIQPHIDIGPPIVKSDWVKVQKKIKEQLKNNENRLQQLQELHQKQNLVNSIQNDIQPRSYDLIQKPNITSLQETKQKQAISYQNNKECNKLQENIEYNQSRFQQIGPAQSLQGLQKIEQD